MKLICAGLSRVSHHTGGRVAVFGVVVLIGLLDFIDGIESRIHNNDAENRVLVDGSIEVVTGAIEELTINDSLNAALGIFIGGVLPSEGNRSGIQKLESLEV